MPSVLTLGGLLVALALHADPSPQDPLYTATVKVPEALVRCKPSDDPKMYPTNRLRQGAVVEVMKELEDGWLEIKPPPGSFDWINTRFVQRLDPYQWVVTAHDDAPAPVLYGSGLVEAKPTVIGPRVRRGSILVAWGKAIVDQKDSDGWFLPIEPPPGEVRYLRADAVTRNPANPTTVTSAAAPPAGGAPEGPPTPVTPAGGFRIPPSAAAAAATAPASPLPPAAEASNDPRWVEAQRLEQEGKTAEAAEKYTLLAQQISSENHDLAMQCYNRAYFLRQSARGGTAAAAAGDSRLHPVPAGSPGTPAAAAPAPQTQQANYAVGRDSAAVGPVMLSDPGQLRVAGRGVDGKRTYVLISSQGQLLMYVTAPPGIDLDTYLDHNVRVSGPLVYRMDLRAYYMSAQQVNPLQ